MFSVVMYLYYSKSEHKIVAEMLENSEYIHMQIKYFRPLWCNNSVRILHVKNKLFDEKEKKKEEETCNLKIYLYFSTFVK